MVPEYKVPLPEGASEEVVNLSKEVNKWANIEMALSFQVDDLEMIIDELGDENKRIVTLKAILKEKRALAKKAEAKYEEALHKMCEAL